MGDHHTTTYAYMGEGFSLDSLKEQASDPTPHESDAYLYKGITSLPLPSKCWTELLLSMALPFPE